VRLAHDCTLHARTLRQHSSLCHSVGAARFASAHKVSPYSRNRQDQPASLGDAVGKKQATRELKVVSGAP